MDTAQLLEELRKEKFKFNRTFWFTACVSFPIIAVFFFAVGYLAGQADSRADMKQPQFNPGVTVLYLAGEERIQILIENEGGKLGNVQTAKALAKHLDQFRGAKVEGQTTWE